jgi:predicted oxidoreductase
MPVSSGNSYEAVEFFRLRDKILMLVCVHRLGTDYIDLLQIHWPDRYIPIFGSDGWTALAALVAAAFRRTAHAFTQSFVK